MRTLIVSEFVTLDGVMEGPGKNDDFKYAGWTMAYEDKAFGELKFGEMLTSDAMLIGRNTYDIFAAFWPNATDEFAQRMNGIQKHVVSTTLDSPTWANTTVIKENIVETITELKKQPGKDILVVGSGILVQTLMQHNLVDLYRLLVFPVVLGTGKRLFKDDSYAQLELVKTEPFSTGVVLLEYKPKQS